MNWRRSFICSYMERGGTIEMAVEIKRSTSPTLSRGFNLAREVLKPRSTYRVHGGTENLADSGGRHGDRSRGSDG